MRACAACAARSIRRFVTASSGGRSAARPRGRCRRKNTPVRSFCPIRGNRRSCPGSRAFRGARDTRARCAWDSSTTEAARSRRPAAARGPLCGARGGNQRALTPASSPTLVPDAANREAAVRTRSRCRSQHRDSVSRCRIRSRQTLAAEHFASSHGSFLAGSDVWLLSRTTSPPPPRYWRRRRCRRCNPRLTGRTDLARHRPLVAGERGRQQRFGPDARGRSGRRTARRPLWLVVARLHAADVVRGEDCAHRHCLQPLLQARVPARAFQVHARSRPRRSV